MITMRKEKEWFTSLSKQLRTYTKLSITMVESLLKIVKSLTTTYTMKRELYTMNENSTHKNDDFCKKKHQKHPPNRKVLIPVYTFFFLG